MKKNFLKLISLLAISLIIVNPSFADDKANVVPPDKDTVEAIQRAQEKLTSAQGLYNTTKSQERAMENLRKASKLSLKAARLRQKAENIQSKADGLIERAKQSAISSGLQFNETMPIKMEGSPQALEQSANADQIESVVPGQPINIIIPSQKTANAEAPVP